MIIKYPHKGLHLHEGAIPFMHALSGIKIQGGNIYIVMTLLIFAEKSLHFRVIGV